MRKLFKKENIFILFITGYLLFSISCTRTFYPDPSVRIDSQSEIKKKNIIKPVGTKNKISTVIINPEDNKLRDFEASGTGKYLNTSKADPEKIIETAAKYLGVPHCMGGTSMKCTDCSGLIVSVFAAYGIKLPHNSQAQARYGKIIYGIGNLVRGDLVFFIRSYNTPNYITHVGIYLGNNEFIHTSVNYGVTITSLNDKYWRPKFVFGTRIFYK